MVFYTSLILQWLLIIATLFFSVGVVLSKNAIMSAVFLMSALFSTGLIYISMGSYFAGAVQILVYAGAVSVLIVFIVMLLDIKTIRIMLPGKAVSTILISLAAMVLFVLFSSSIFQTINFNASELPYNFLQGKSATSVKTISSNFSIYHMLSFQMIGLLLLSAIVGVVMIALGDRKDSV